MDTDPNKWLYDKISEDLVQLHRIREVLYRGQTRYQSVEIVRSGDLGKCLVLDGKIQSADRDEFIYHEAIVQPAMITHPKPEAAFIAGGGEGATLREILSHKTVKRAVMVDIDGEVVALCRKYLPDHSRSAFEDRRTELHIADAREYLAKCGEKFDIIIIDLPDPLKEGPAYLLYTMEFYQIVRNRLNDNGIISIQAGSASPTESMTLSAVNNTLKSVFPIVSVYQVHIPAFGGPWGFCCASLNLSPALLSPPEIDSRIAARSLTHLKFYDGLTHQGMFSLPKYLRESLAEPGRLISDKEPLFTYTGR